MMIPLYAIISINEIKNREKNLDLIPPDENDVLHFHQGGCKAELLPKSHNQDKFL